MPGETPNASKITKRRKLRWDDDRSTNKIYASGQTSALTPSTGEGVGRPGRKPKPIPTPVARSDDKSTDKYYASGGTKRNAAKPRPVAAPVPGRPPAELRVDTKDDISPVVDDVVDRLHAGVTEVVVGVSTGNIELMRRVRTAFDLAVTRQRITEEQYRDVKMIYFGAPGTQVAVGRAQTKKLDLSKPPVPATTVAADVHDGPSDEELMAMLENRTPLPDDPFDTTAQTAQEVDEDDDPLLVRPGAEPPRPGRDQEGATAGDVGVLPSVASQPPASAEPPLPPISLRQRPKRTGRGVPPR